MVVRIRLARFGNRNHPFYRIVVANAKSPRDGKHLDRVGFFNPLPTPQGFKLVGLNFDRLQYWLSVGAQPSERVAKLFGMAGMLPPYPKRKVGTKKSMPKGESEKS